MEENQLREQFLSGKTIFDGHVVHLELWQVALPNGEKASREVVLHPGAAAVVPIDENGNVILVRQHRIALNEITLEIPAGKLDKGAEDPLEAAKRELEEETGLQAQNWVLLTRLATTPGFTNEKISIYLATGLTKTQAHTDEDEFVDTCILPLAEAVDLCKNGTLTDSKTIAGLLLAKEHLAS